MADLKAIVNRLHRQYIKEKENEVINTNSNLLPLRKLEEIKVNLDYIKLFINKNS